MSDKKTKNISDFFAKKTKKPAKAVNLNAEKPLAEKQEEVPTAAEVSEEKENLGTHGVSKLEKALASKNDPSPKQKNPNAQFGNLLPEVEEKSNGPAWSAAPKEKVPAVGAAKGNFGKGGFAQQSYQAGKGFGEKQYPPLGTLLKTHEPVQNRIEPLSKGGMTNAYSNLEVDDDSDDEDNLRSLPPSLVVKEKGQMQLKAKKNLTEAEKEDMEKKEKENDEKQKRQKELKVAKEAERKQKEQDQKGGGEEKELVIGGEGFILANFGYGRFNVTACEEKYAGRSAVVAC